ncbi:MAG: glycoside hydrolase family 25 protein [Sphingobacteriaceae bacterium]
MKKPISFKWKALIAGVLLILLSPFYYGYVIQFFASGWAWVSGFGQEADYRIYGDFDIPIPGNYTIHGIDVSYYQGKIDWQKVKAMKENEVKVSFAFIKATEGLLLVDRYFHRNWREAPKAGIVCGAYHFFRPKKNGLFQAKFFLQNVTLERGDLLPVVDVEVLDGVPVEEMRLNLQQFVQHIEAKTGVKPIIYSSIKFYEDYLQGYFEGYPLWIAHYYKPKLKIRKNTTWHFWQHADNARVNGIKHMVDFNVFNGDSLTFHKLLVP